MNFEELGVIKYGELRFVFKVSPAVRKYMNEKGINSESFFPKTQFFYQGVLTKMNISHEDLYDVDVIYHGIRLNGEGVSEVLEGNYAKFDNFPIHEGDLIYLSDFGVQVNERVEVKSD